MGGSGSASAQDEVGANDDGPTGIRGLLGLAESYGAATLPRSLFVERCGAGVVDALLALGAIGPACRSAAYPCGDDRRNCSRTVTEDGKDPLLPLVASCNREPAKCDSLRLSEEACQEHAILLRGLEIALCALFHVHPTVSRREPPLEKLGVQRTGRERDVFIAWQPSEPAFSLAVRLRETIDRPALVLVPTRAGLAPDMTSAHGPRSRVEIVALDEVLFLENGEIIHRETKKSGRREPRVIVTQAHPVKLPRLEAWRDLLVYRVLDSEEMVVICVGRARAKATYVDLGMVCADSRKPNEVWRSLLWLCTEFGVYRQYGSRERIRKRVERLRARLQAVFGLEDDPFERPTAEGGWKAKFRAFPSTPSECDERLGIG